jgi:hypothetical protein
MKSWYKYHSPKSLGDEKVDALVDIASGDKKRGRRAEQPLGRLSCEIVGNDKKTAKNV